MPTDKPGVMTYLEPGLYEKLLELKEKRGAKSLSQTVEEILKEYFGNAISSTLSNTLFLEQQRQLVQQITDLTKKYEILQETIVDLQSIVLAVANVTQPGSTPINLLIQQLIARQVSQQLSQQKRENGAIQDKYNLKILTQSQKSDGLALEDIKQGLTGTQLANRLNIHSSNLSRKRSNPTFSSWSQQLDPNNISWMYNAISRKFYPCQENVFSNFESNSDARRNH
jgi:hypothetical protein